MSSLASVFIPYKEPNKNKNVKEPQAFFVTLQLTMLILYVIVSCITEDIQISIQYFSTLQKDQIIRY